MNTFQKILRAVLYFTALVVAFLVIGLSLFGRSKAPAEEPVSSAVSVPAPTAEPSLSPTPTLGPEIPAQLAEKTAANPDVYGWITIPGTNIDYPVLQHPTNDGFYLSHADDKTSHSFGSIYSEATYNHRDFSDRVTLLYGHDIWTDDLFFHQLHLLEEESFFAGHDTVYTYLPDTVMEWQILAAFNTDDRHLMASYDCFTDKEVLAQYLDWMETLVGTGCGLFRNEALWAATAQDTYLILSTCNRIADDQRFLVVCRLVKTTHVS